MKTRILSIITVALVIALAAVSQIQNPQTQNHKHRIVFEVNSGPDTWTQMLGNIDNARKALGGDEVQVEVVCHGKGLALLLKTNTEYADRLKKTAGEGVVLAACQNSMRTQKVAGDDLVPFATQVDSGVAEVVRKQEAGWSYLKSGG
jgi:intracellular sulfur oxidation DsrE/DsrF family protein